MIVGQHFLDRNKEWGIASSKTVSLVDVGYIYPSPGFSVREALERLAEDCNILWNKGVFARPYLRIDYALDLTLKAGAEYNRAVMLAMEWWCGAPRANLTIIIGNEPNLGNIVYTDEVAQCVKDACYLRDLLGYPVRIFAPAVAPFAGTPCDIVSPRGNSTPWEDWQYGIAKKIEGANFDGYALHAYGRPYHIFDKDEAHSFRAFGDTAASNGFLWYKDALAQLAYFDSSKPIAVTEYNTFTDRPSSESYPYGHFSEARRELESDPRFESLSIFVGEPHGEQWAQESTKLRIGQCAAMDDDLNVELAR